MKASSPRLMVYDTALMITASKGACETWLTDPAKFGHLAESAVGAYLLARSQTEGFDLWWWREGNLESDFVISKGESVTAIEVKSGAVKSLAGLEAFRQRFPGASTLVIGTPQAPLEEFLAGKLKLF